MTSGSHIQLPGPPAAIEARIRAMGPVLDMPATRQIYETMTAYVPRPNVDVLRDLAYGPNERHRLDVYRPRSAAKELPIVLIFHGGGFIRGDKMERSNAGYFFADQGYLTILPNYRLGPQHHWPAGGEDVVAALAWAQAHGAEFGGDAGRIWLVGESAGAAHVATATLLKRLQPTSGLGIRGAVLISGVYDVHMELLARRQFGVPSPDPRNEAYFGTDFSRYPEMSLVEHIDADPFPLLITFAELDLIAMQVQAGELFARLVRQGYSPDIEVIRGHNHLTQVFSVNTGDESLSAPVLKFMNQNC